MWFGAEDGLNKYDGYSFTIYRHEPDHPHSLSHDHILTIYEDRLGVLWVGTLGGGLNRFDRNSNRFTRYQHHPDDATNLGDEANEVWSIYESEDGSFWIGTDTGLEQLDRETGEFTHYHTVIANPFGRETVPIFDIYEDGEGDLWVGTDGGGLNRFESQTGAITHSGT